MKQVLQNLQTGTTDERIEYLGPFRNPGDLSDIYSAIYVNFVVYDTSSKNVRLAIPNKYFESAFFGVPMLAAVNTALGDRVLEASIGRTVDISNYECFRADLMNITPNWVAEYRPNYLKVPEQELIDNSSASLRKMLTECEIAPKPD